MTTEKPEGRRKGGGGKLARSETVTVRLDPRLRYLAELAARKQRRTLSSYIEWAVEESLSHVFLREAGGTDADYFDRSSSVAAMADALWDVDEADRLAKLAFQFHELMTHEEQVLWKLIREKGGVFRGRKRNGEWDSTPTLDTINLAHLRLHWATFVAVAKGDLDETELPQESSF